MKTSRHRLRPSTLRWQRRTSTLRWSTRGSGMRLPHSIPICLTDKKKNLRLSRHSHGPISFYTLKSYSLSLLRASDWTCSLPQPLTLRVKPSGRQKILKALFLLTRKERIAFPSIVQLKNSKRRWVPTAMRTRQTLQTPNDDFKLSV